jgi:hypothetical protein
MSVPKAGSNLGTLVPLFEPGFYSDELWLEIPDGTGNIDQKSCRRGFEKLIITGKFAPAAGQINHRHVDINQTEA